MTDLTIQNIKLTDIWAYKNNPKLHNRAQVAKIRESIREFGFINPVLLDKNLEIIAGHGRVAAAQDAGMTEVPAIILSHLTDAQKRAYRIADNKLTELGKWSIELLNLEFSELSNLDLDFNLGITGFETAEIVTVCRIFEKYNELQSLTDLHHWCITNNIKNKRWTTQKGATMGGTVFCKHALNNLLRNPVYIGKVRNKKTNEIYPGLHEGIVQAILFNTVQELLSQNNNRRTSQCLHRRYMLHRKIFDMAGNMFTNKSTKKSDVRHYCRPGIYLAAGDIERITCDTIQALLNGDLSQLVPADVAQTWKAIDFQNMTYDARTKLLETLLARAVYNNSHMTFYINIAPIADEFQTPGHTNTCNAPLSTNVCLSNDGQHIIIERPVIINNRVSTNRYEACGHTVMTIQENNLQLMRALAYGWLYKSMFERGQNAQQIAKTEHKAERTIYKYLALAYLSPKIVSDIMDGAAPAIDLQTLFAIAAKHMDFKEQEKEFTDYAKLGGI